MPRSAAAARRGHNSSSNNHNTISSNHTNNSNSNNSAGRNENGSAANGKRLGKQKSSSHLNGNAASASSSSTSYAAHYTDLRSSSDSSIVTTPKTDGLKTDSADHLYTSGSDHKTNGDMAYGHNNGAFASDPALSSAKPPAASSKRHASSSVNPFALASTILRSCPLYDTVAILIFLLQLPPMVLTLVQFLFASLTFMPPGGGSGSLTSNFDIFQGPAGTPSFGTMLAMDGFCLLMWGLFMWTWAQNFALDLAHVQVAITLGGGGSGKNGGVNALCVGTVLLLHIVRSKGIQDFVIGHLTSAQIISPDVLSRWSHLIPTEFRRTESQSSPSWLRSLLAIHILAQAGTAMARRSMARNRSPQPSRSGKRIDAEASAGSQAQIDSAFESTASMSMGLDGSLSGPSALKESRERLQSAKKRRRQANQVRSRQPFWAALASTKVTVMREYEHSRAVSKTTRGLPMTEDDLQGITLDDGLIWITSVDSSTIKFAAGEFGTADDATSSSVCENGHLGSNEVEPFYVCVNGALWATANLIKVTDGTKRSSTVQWRGEITGLAPNCAYTCSFRRNDSDEEICSLSVKTPAAPDADQSTVSIMPTPPRPFHRPSSPTSTLRNSIANAESKLNEKRSRLKRAKADHKMLLSRIKKELDNFNHRLSSGNDENRQKQRSLQLERNIRQTEEATAALESQLGDMDKIPEEELEEWQAQKAEFERELELLNTAKEELITARTSVSREIASLESDYSSAVQKRERLQSRKTRLNEQYERIISANAQGLNERERRAAEQFAREQEQAKIEANFNEQLASISRAVQDYQMRTNQLWQQASSIEQAIQQQQQQTLFETGPLTPEGIIPGTHPELEEETDNSSQPYNNLTITPANSRSILGASFSALRSSPHQTTPTFATGSTSQTASPLQATIPQTSGYQASPRLSVANYLGGRDFAYRNRSSSNRSARSSFYADLDYDFNRYLLDPAERASSGSDGKGQTSPTYGAIGSPFTRAGSRGSGGSSGHSGSGSGSGSPRSTRAEGL